MLQAARPESGMWEEWGRFLTPWQVTFLSLREVSFSPVDLFLAARVRRRLADERPAVLHCVLSSSALLEHPWDLRALHAARLCVKGHVPLRGLLSRGTGTGAVWVLACAPWAVDSATRDPGEP